MRDKFALQHEFIAQWVFERKATIFVWFISLSTTSMIYIFMNFCMSKNHFLKHEFTAIYLLFWLWYFYQNLSLAVDLCTSHIWRYISMFVLCGGWKCTTKWRMNFVWRGGVKNNKFKLQWENLFLSLFLCRMINWNHFLRLSFIF